MISREDEAYLIELYNNVELGDEFVTAKQISDRLGLQLSNVKFDFDLLCEIGICESKLGFNGETVYSLSKKGITLAGKLLRNIRLRELMITKIGYEISQIPQIFDEINFNDRIGNEILNFFQKHNGNGNNESQIRCPHGSLIPLTNGDPQLENFFQLNDSHINSELILHRLDSCTNSSISSSTSFDFFIKNDLRPGLRVIILKIDPDFVTLHLIEENIQINVSNHQLSYMYFIHSDPSINVRI